MLQELGFSNGVARYDPENSPHINIICKGCGKIQDHESESVRSFLRQITAELDHTPVGQRLEIFICCDNARWKL